jgi:hypothetical protein
MSFSGKPELTTLDPVSNDGFWCDVTLDELMTLYRIPAEYDNGVIRQGLVMGIIRINERLKPVKAVIVLAGGSSFSAYVTAHPNYSVGGVEWAIHEYKNAVYCKAKAMLLQNFNTLNRRKDAENDAKESPQTEEYWANQAQQSIFNLLNRYAPDFALSANSDTFIGLI